MPEYPLKCLKAGAIVPITMETVRAAIDAGDWIVDGACDPERHLSKYVKRNNEEF